MFDDQRKFCHGSTPFYSSAILLVYIGGIMDIII